MRTFRTPGRVLLAVASLASFSCAADDANVTALAAPLDDAPGTWAVGAAVEAADAPSAARTVLGARPDLRLLQTRESLTGEHVRYQQLAPDGSEVLDGQVSVHFTGFAPSYELARVWDRPKTLRLANPRRKSDAFVRAAALAAAATREATRSIAVGQVTLAALPVARGSSELRAGWRVLVETRGPVHEWEVFVDGETGVATVRRDLVWTATGTAKVYLPNPITTTGNLALRDNNNATSAALDAARVAVTLQRLDGSGDLKGDFVDVQPGDGSARAHKTDLNYDFDRSQTAFEEVNTYQAIDSEQAFLQGLGFRDAKSILALPFVVLVNAIPDDNSFYTGNGGPHIETGTGGVDDAEDADVIHHEYGHAMHGDMIPGYGGSDDAAAMGEGFGDIMAASVPTGAPVMVDRACVAPWDATSYSSSNPPCLRRVDGHRHFPEHVDQPEREPHDDGEIWSGAIWDMYQATSLGSEKGAQLVVEAFFSVAPDVSFVDYSEALIAADVALYQGMHVDAIKQVMWRHGLLRTTLPAGSFAGATQVTEMAVSKTHLLDDVDEETTIHQDGASAIQLHFAGFDMQSGSGVQCLDGHCDNVYLYDGAGQLYAILGGQLGAFDAPIVPGDTVVVRWVTDGSISSGGFAIDHYTWSGGGAGAPDAGPDAGPGGADDGSGGCGCRVGRDGDGGRRPTGVAVVVGLVALALLRRRRRARTET